MDAVEHDRGVVIPPVLRGTGDMEVDIVDHWEASLDLYSLILVRMQAKGIDGKKAREAARAVLPNATPVDFVVTGNLRCWRDVLGKRYHMAADAEIREFATEVLGHLTEIAPHSVQDIPSQPWE